MAKNRKISVAVRHQVAAARATDASEPGDRPLTGRAAMALARLAGRQARKEAIAARQTESGLPLVKPPRPMPRTKPIVEHRLTVDGLVTFSRDTIGFRLGATANPYINLLKGTVGVLVARNIWAGAAARRGQRVELCHVMLPAGIVEVGVAVVRDCSDDQDEA